MTVKPWTEARLRALKLHERAELYRKAVKLGDTPQGKALKQMIEDVGLPYSEDAALTDADPITLKMIDVIYSREGKEAARHWHALGQPPMAGIDPLLQAALGSDYGPHNRGTIKAGEITGALMRSLGFKKGPERPLPDNCVAKTAATWV